MLKMFDPSKQSDMFTKAFYQKGAHSFQKDALLFIFSIEFEGALLTMAIKMKALK